MQRFRPPPGPNALMTVDRAQVGEHLQPGFGLWINHGAEPLVQHHPDGRREPLVEGQTGFDLTGAVGLWNRAEVGFALPLSNLSSQGFGPGDLRLSGKVRVLGVESGDATAVRLEVSLPTGDATAFRGSDAVGFSGWYVPTWVFGPVDLSLNAGLMYRPSAQLEALQSGTELHVGIGSGLNVMDERLRLVAEVNGSTGVSSLDAVFATETTPVEVLFGAHFKVFEGFRATGGGGIALTEGYGTPSWRVIIGAYWAPHISRDADGDGILDDVDQCPEQAEDMDGLEDDDGCPEDDVDGDGVPDVDDKCPLRPEDLDGFEDEDGCPDVDNDNDLIADANDQCPNEPEDRDGFQDEDGCPDLDDDGDGVPDAQDKCPAHKEDLDGFEDEDGCPDEDDDKDGFPDDVDRCPREPETYNGIEDDDGCPDGDEVSHIVVTDRRLDINLQIFFKFESDQIKKKSIPLLREVGLLLRAHPKIKTVLIEGHSDAMGNARLNRLLSKKRAKQVRKILVKKFGVPKHRLVVEGFGELRPQASNETRKGRAKNRRVQFLIIEWDRSARSITSASGGSGSTGKAAGDRDKKGKKKKKKKKRKKKRKKKKRKKK